MMNRFLSVFIVTLALQTLRAVENLQTFLKGSFDELGSWLRRNVHHQGKKGTKDTQDKTADNITEKGPAKKSR